MKWEILRNRNFLLYWLSSWISALGDAVFFLALTWLVVETTGSGMVMGTLLLTMGIPRMVFMLVGGVVVDRYDPKKIMIASDVIRALLMLQLFLVSLNGDGIPLWNLFVTGALFGSVEAFFWPAAFSVRQRLVSSEFYTQSNSLLIVASQVSSIIGPLIGAGLVVFGGYDLVVILNGISFLIGTTMMRLVKLRPIVEEEVPTDKRHSFKEDLLFGIKFIFQTPLILTTTLTAFFVNFSVSAAMVAVPFLAEELGTGVEGLGVMNAGLGIGGGLAAILFAIFVIQQPTPRMTLMACFFEGICLMLLCITGNLWLAAIFLGLIGVSETAINVVAPSVNQSVIPAALFGRVSSTLILVMQGSEPLAQAISGWMIDVTDTTTTVFLTGGILEVIVAIVAFFVPAVRYYGKEKGKVKLTI